MLIFDVNLPQLKEKSPVHEWIAQRLAGNKGGVTGHSGYSGG